MVQEEIKARINFTQYFCSYYHLMLMSLPVLSDSVDIDLVASSLNIVIELIDDDGYKDGDDDSDDDGDKIVMMIKNNMNQGWTRTLNT